MLLLLQLNHMIFPRVIELLLLLENVSYMSKYLTVQ